jgi:hypothetical protein
VTRREAIDAGEAEHDAGAIADAIRDQLSHGPYERDELFGDGTAGPRIAEVLAGPRPSVQKRLRYGMDTPLRLAEPAR